MNIFLRVNNPVGRRALLLAACISLAACGGGGGDRAPGVEPGPAPPGSGTPPAPLPPEDPTAIDVADISADDTVTTSVESVTMASPPTITFRLEVDGRRVTGLTGSNLRLSLAQLTHFLQDENIDHNANGHPEDRK